MAKLRKDKVYSNPLVEIFNGNSLELLKSFDSNSVHLIITDPPYFIDGMGDEWDQNKLNTKIKKASAIGGLPVGMRFDPIQGIRFEKFYYQISKELFRILKAGGFFLSFSQPRLYHRMAIAVENCGFEIRDQYAWHYTNKSQMKAFSQDHFVKKRNISNAEKEHIIKKLSGRKTAQLKPQFESILMAQKPKVGTAVDNWLVNETGLIDATETLNNKSPSTVMSVDKPIKEAYNNHPTVKPVKLLNHLIKLFSIEGQIVLDPFVGSGSTLVACKQTKRYGIGIEINKDYIEIAKKRINGD